MSERHRHTGTIREAGQITRMVNDHGGDVLWSERLVETPPGDGRDQIRTMGYILETVPNCIETSHHDHRV